MVLRYGGDRPVTAKEAVGYSVDGQDELAPHVPGVADLLGRGRMVERVGGDGGDELACRGVLGQGGQAGGRAFLGPLGEGDPRLPCTEAGDGDDALRAAPAGG